MIRWLFVLLLATSAFAAPPSTDLEVVGEFTIKAKDANIGLAGRCAFSPDERSLAVEAGQVFTIDLQTKEVKPSAGTQLLGWLTSGLCYRDVEGWVYRDQARLLRLPWTREHILTTTEGHLMAVMPGDKRCQARLWNLATGDRIGEWDFPWVALKAGAGTGRWLAATLPGSSVGVWDLTNHRELCKFSGFTDTDNIGMAFTPDRSLLIVAKTPPDPDSSGVLSARNPRNGEEVSNISTPARGLSEALAVTPSGTLVAAGCGDSVALWDIPGKAMLERTAKTRGKVDWIAFSPSGKLMAATSRPGKDERRLVKVWKLP